MYKLILKIGDKTQVTQGKTILSAVSKLKSPPIVKFTGLLEFYKDKELIKRIGYNIPRLKALFNDTKPYYREVFAKNLSLFLK